MLCLQRSAGGALRPRPQSRILEKQKEVHSEPLCMASLAFPSWLYHPSLLLTRFLHHKSSLRKASNPWSMLRTLTCARPWMLCHSPHLSCAFCSPIRYLCSQVPFHSHQRFRAPKWQTLVLLPPELSTEVSLSSAPTADPAHNPVGKWSEGA